MRPLAEAVWVSALLLVFVLLCIELGYRIGRRRRPKLPEGASAALGGVDAAIFGLLGLIIAFTFAGAASRLDARRQLIVTEANAIGTAYLRLDLLSPSEQPALRDLFRRYLAARLDRYEKLPDREAAAAALAEANRLQAEIWSRAQAACQDDARPAPALLLLPALNEMIDITTTREIALTTHTPLAVLTLLLVLALLGATLVGYSMSAQTRRSPLHIALFAAAISLSVYVVLDLEYPRAGLIQLKSTDKAMIYLRDLMK